MTDIKPMNDLVLIKIEEKEEKKGNVFLGEDNTKPKIAEILAFSEKCENENLEIGKKAYVRKCEMIPHEDSKEEYFISEKAIVAIF